jgi:hypothetical protein
MRHTLKAIFDKRSDAQHLLDKLLASGYKHADSTNADTEHDKGFGTSVRHTFARMFGTKHHEEPASTQDGSDNAQHVVTVTSESEPDAMRAARIIESHEPDGIEEHHEHSDQDGAGNYFPGVATIGTVYPPGTRPGSLQFRVPEDSHYFGTQNAESPPTGNTFQERTGRTPWASQDEDTLDWPGDRSSEDAAAYRYGEEMRASAPSPAPSWEELEPDLQSGWERKRVEMPAWHRIREAVRRGWDRVRH